MMRALRIWGVVLAVWGLALPASAQSQAANGSMFGVPRLAANGTLMRINYQVDGNTNTEKDRAGLRLLPLSEVMVSEVKVVTAGYAPELGQTMGLVYNAITPSGTNQVHGDASYLFRRKSFNHIYSVQSNGDGHYNALSLILNRRWAAGVTYNLSYTIGNGIDNAPASDRAGVWGRAPR